MQVVGRCGFTAWLTFMSGLHMPNNDGSISREAELISQRLNSFLELRTGRHFTGGNDEMPKPELPPPFPRIPHHVEYVALAPAQHLDAFVVLASEDVLRQALRALCSRDAEALDDHRSGPPLG